jgi:hypothetical protein
MRINFQVLGRIQILGLKTCSEDSHHTMTNHLRSISLQFTDNQNFVAAEFPVYKLWMIISNSE